MKGKINTDSEIPVKVGDVLKLGVIRFGRDGDPVMIYEGFVIFLKDIKKRGVQLNTMLEIQITKVCGKFAFAERIDG